MWESSRDELHVEQICSIINREGVMNREEKAG